jgi:hypothetical protein
MSLSLQPGIQYGENKEYEEDDDEKTYTDWAPAPAAASSSALPAVSSSRQYAETRKRGAEIVRKRGYSSIQQTRFLMMQEDIESNSDDLPFRIDTEVEEKKDAMPESGRFLEEYVDDGKGGRRKYRQDKWDKEAAPRAVDEEEATRLVNQFIEERAQAIKRREKYHRSADVEMREASVGLEDTASDGVVGVDEADALYERMLGLSIATEEEAANALKINDRHTLSTDPMRESRHCAGDRRLEAIIYTLNNLGYVRSEFQKKLHLHFLQASLPVIYGDDWATHAERVLAEFGLDKISAEVMALAPRRHGKTMSVAMFVLSASYKHNHWGERMIVFCPSLSNRSCM